MNAYAQFLERYGAIVAAIAWSKSRTEPGVVAIAIHQGNPRLGFRPDRSVRLKLKRWSIERISLKRGSLISLMVSSVTSPRRYPRHDATNWQISIALGLPFSQPQIFNGRNLRYLWRFSAL